MAVKLCLYSASKSMSGIGHRILLDPALTGLGTELRGSRLGKISSRCTIKGELTAEEEQKVDWIYSTRINCRCFLTRESPEVDQ